MIHLRQTVAIVPGTGDASSLVFGSAVAGDTYICRGWRKLALVTTLSNTTNYGNLYYQHGSLNFGDTYNAADSKIIYTHYFSANSDSILIGNYPKLTYPTSDPSYRADAKRIYNSVINSDTRKTPDVDTSNFQVRFTKADTLALSLYAINSDWTLTESTNPAKLGPYQAGDSLTLPTVNKYLNINVDNVGWVSIDVTGGTSYGSGKYDLNKLVSTRRDRRSSGPAPRDRWRKDRAWPAAPWRPRDSRQPRPPGLRAGEPSARPASPAHGRGMRNSPVICRNRWRRAEQS